MLCIAEGTLRCVRGRSILPSNKSPEASSGAFVVSPLALRCAYVRVRIRIMKLSKLSSATCCQASVSLR